MSIADVHAKGNYIIGVRKSIIGTKVVNPARETLGEIEDLVIDSRNAQIAYAILASDGFLGIAEKHFAIPWQAIHYDAERRESVLHMNKEQFENAPGFDKEDWPDMADPEWITRVHIHYGYRPYWENSDHGP